MWLVAADWLRHVRAARAGLVQICSVRQRDGDRGYDERMRRGRGGGADVSHGWADVLRRKWSRGEGAERRDLGESMLVSAVVLASEVGLLLFDARLSMKDILVMGRLDWQDGDGFFLVLGA